MTPKNKAEISKEKLLAAGWEETGDQAFPVEKKIPNRNPINNTPEDSDIKLVLHSMYNVWRFAIALPDGGLINFVANTMSELHDFESKIDFYDPPF